MLFRCVYLITLLWMCLRWSADLFKCGLIQPNIITPDGISSERGRIPVFLSLNIPLDILFDPKQYFLEKSYLFLSRHFTPGKISDWHIFCSGRIVSGNFRDKEGVENAVLKVVVSGSREEAILHSIPSHGHNYRGAVGQDRRRWH